jgi:hypothetical protein
MIFIFNLFTINHVKNEVKSSTFGWPAKFSDENIFTNFNHRGTKHSD